jgi:S-DNA-T family DNA segregation ATPase FtsK/SpoIIIE
VKLKLALRRSGGEIDDIAVTVDATVTLGVLVQEMLRRDPRGNGSPLPTATTLAPYEDGRSGQPYPSTSTVAEVGLRSGQTVTFAAATGGAHTLAGPPAATLRVLDGPDAGKEFPLPYGSSYIGRDRSSDVRLADPLVSKQHARINVTDTVEVVDTNSSNGVKVGGDLVQRALLRPDDVVVLGDTSVVVTAHNLGSRTAPLTSPTVDFNRSPRLDPHFAGVELVAPEPPSKPQRRRLPIVPLLIPPVMGAVLYLVTKSVASLTFIALSPLMLIGNYVEGRSSGKRELREATAVFQQELALLGQQMTEAHQQERASRLAEHPATSDVLDAAVRLRPLLWTRRPDDQAFLDLRLGIGSRPSRSTVQLPSSRQTTPDLWDQLNAFAASYRDLSGVPVVAKLTESGGLGICGPEDSMMDVARAVLVQVLGLHSPAEVLLAGLCGSSSTGRWDWLKWLPHTSSAHSPLQQPHLASSPGACLNLVAELEDLVEQRAAHDDRQMSLPAVVLLVDNGAPIDRSRLVTLAERGPARGVFVLWCAPVVEQLPAACRTFVDATDPAHPVVGYVATGESVAVTVERLDAASSVDFARALAPVVDSGARVDDESDLPRSVSFAMLSGPTLMEASDLIVERWTESNSIADRSGAPARRRTKDNTLRAIIGQAATEPLYLDLRTHGPHALVGGTTGSGKSELLQSWILGMAAAHSPDRVTFLFVDYKGGSAFADCLELPHTVGLVTDLSPHLVRRALVSLNAELRYREHVLARKKVKDLLELERQGDPEAPPSLVIVVDEFAALVQEVPEFVDGVVNVAQRGRSLGLHLILATQRPAGVIKDNLRANTNLRLALRMADEADSTDVLGTPSAAGFDPGVPGRAIAKTGPGRLIPFQAAYAGGWTTSEPPRPAILIEELRFGTGARWDEPEETATVVAADPGPNDIRRLVNSIGEAARTAGIPPARKPWLAELAPVYDLAELPTTRTDTELVFGVRDDPDLQEQPVLAFYPDRDGNLAVYGTGGSGKSTLLRTLAIAAGFTVRGGPCHVYGIDFGARGLHMLEELPHVGSIIGGDDHERIVRLIGWLRSVVDERAVRYARAHAGTVSEYRDRAGKPDEPRFLLLVDNIAAFRQAYESNDRVRWLDMFTSLAVDGRPVGVHVILSSDQRFGMSTALASAVQSRVVLRLASEDDYGLLGVPADVLASSSPPGRGLFRDAEMQVAVLGGAADIPAQASAIRRFVGSMRRAGSIAAVPIQRLPERVQLKELSLVDGLGIPVGLSSTTLGPFTVQPRGAFIVCGPPGSGRTTALQTLVEALRSRDPSASLFYFGNRRSSLAAAPVWTEQAFGAAEAVRLATQLSSSWGQGGGQGERHIAVFVEGVGDFAGGAADAAMQEMGKACLAQEHWLVVEGETSAFSGSFGFLATAKSGRSGIALAPDQGDGTTVYRTNFPRTNRADFPPGRGLHVSMGKTEVVQVALSE